MSPVKEPHFFAPNYSKNDYIKPIGDKKQYLELFVNVKDEKAIGEASTGYLWDPESPKKISEIIPNARIIAILRDPISRAFSHYLQHVRSNTEKHSFHEAIRIILETFEPQTSKRYLHAGLYSNQIRRYLDIFGSSHVKIIIFEEFIQNPQAILNEVLKFLNINYQITKFENSIYNTYTLPRGKIESKILNDKLVRKISQKIMPKNTRKILKDKILLAEKKPTMSKEDKEILKNFFSNDVKELEKIFGRKLPWPNFND